MPAVATRKEAVSQGRKVDVVALTHSFYDLNRYRRGDELAIHIPEGQRMPAWCIPANEAPRDRDGRVNLNELPLFFPASARN